MRESEKALTSAVTVCPDEMVTLSSESGIPSASEPVIVQVEGVLQLPVATDEKVAAFAEILNHIGNSKESKSVLMGKGIYYG